MSKEAKIKTEPKLVNAWKITTVTICVITFGILMYGYIYHKTEMKKINDLKVEATAKVSALNSELVGSNDLLRFKTDDLNKLKEQMSGIKDKSDLLKRDIQFYIETTHPKVPRVVAKEIAHQIVTISKKHKVSPELVVGIVKVESAFNPMAVGPKTKYGHARGLMQVMKEWAPKLGLKSQYDFHNIDIGIESGIKVFLIHLEEGKGDISTGLYYYVNKDRKYVANVYAAMGKFVAFRSTIDEEGQNVDTDIDNNGDSKKLPADDKKEGKKS